MPRVQQIKPAINRLGRWRAAPPLVVALALLIVAVQSAASQAAGPPALTSPVPGSILPGRTVTFNWSAGTGVAEYALSVGDTPGGTQYFGASTGLNRSAKVHRLPADGRRIYVRLRYRVAGVWQATDATYTAAGGTPTVSPTPSSSPSPTPTPSPTPSPSPSPMPSTTPTPSPSPSPSPTPSPTPKPSATPTPSPSASPMPTPTPTASPTPLPTPTPTPTPTASPTPTPTPTPSPSPSASTLVPVQGSSIKDTAYPIPAAALFVSPGGNDQNPGTSSAPLRTVQRAVDLASAGTTIVLRQGEYREFVRINGKRLTLQPYPHEQAWVKGSVVVSGWVPDGAAWRRDNWSYTFAPATPPTEDPGYPMAKYPEMAFIDGRPLAQVSSRAAVVAGTFFVDRANQRLYIGENPSGKAIEATAFSNVLEAYNASGSAIRGLGFAHAASTATSGSGAVTVDGDSDSVLVENNTFAWNAASGFEVGPSSNVTVRGNAMLYNGLVGMSGWGYPRATVVESNRFAYNNQEHFDMYWAAGGIKIVTSRDLIVRDNIVEQNLGTGIWCDISCYNSTIVRNVVRNNDLYGIHYEISARAIIASNIASNSRAAGIYVADSSDVKIYNNSIVNNIRSIGVSDSTRANTNAAEIALGITWETRNVIVKNNIMSHSNVSNQHVLGVYHDQNMMAAEQMVSGIDNNAYYRRQSTSPGATERWGRAGGDSLYYYSLAEFRAATSYEPDGVAVDNVALNPFFVDEAAGDYRLKSGSSAAGAGEPLPADVAGAIGVTAGSAVDIGALVWPGK